MLSRSERLLVPGNHRSDASMVLDGTVEEVMDRPLVVAVPRLGSYEPHTGIGRVFHSLRSHWGERVRLVDVPLDSFSLPVLRNFPFGVRVPDHVDLVLLPKIAWALSLRNTRRVPSFVIVHDIGIVDFPGDRQEMDWLAYFSILRGFRGLQHASHVVAVSQFTLSRLIRHAPSLKGRVSVISNGVNRTFLNHSRTRSESREQVARQLRQYLGFPLLLNVGSESPRKNIALLLQVFERVRDRYPEAVLIKVGDPGRDRWRTRTLDLARSLGLTVGRDLLLLDAVDDPALADLYCAADVLVSTSLYEGFGLPALEAMAVGTPVVVTNRGSFPEVVGDVGWVAEPELDTFAEAVLATLAGARCEDRLLKGRERAVALTWSLSAERYLKAMKYVARRHARLGVQDAQ